MTDALRTLLLRLKEKHQPQPSDWISPADKAKTCLATACRRLGYPTDCPIEETNMLVELLP